MVERADDEWIALAALAGAEFWCSYDSRRWYVDMSNQAVHPIERAKNHKTGDASFSSLAEIARAYCEWLAAEAKLPPR